MEFLIEFYESIPGRCPVREFLDDLKRTDPGDFVAILAGLAKLKNLNYHKPPLSKAIGDELFELRHVGKLNTRILYFFREGRRIVALHGIRSKAIKIVKQDRQVAIERRLDWLKRFPK